MNRGRENGNGRSPADLAGALFMLAWAGAGWISVATNEQLAAFEPGPLDPGPQWMARIVLVLLTAGACALAFNGLLHMGARPAGAAGPEGPQAHGRPAAFLVSLLLYVLVMPFTGFIAATAVFAFAWILFLSPRRREQPVRTAATAAAAAAVITAVIHLGFVVAIRAPLP
jgi:uncharacterized BrkB/YihY/UPF0761 family membrane protein